MKHRMICLAALLLSLLFFPACSKDKQPEEPAASEPVRSIEQSDVWTLSDRYPVTYSSLTYFVTYDANGEQFCLKASRNKKETGMSKRVAESREIDGGIVFALCESKLQNDSKKAVYTYYECYTGEFRYYIGREDESGFYIQDVLSMDDAIALMNTPDKPSGSVRFLDAEWNAQFRTEASNLEILIRPDDGGALIRSLSSSYEAVTENGETYYVSSSADDIVYTNGVHSVQIRQANRAGSEPVDYHTLSECKAILALLG